MTDYAKMAKEARKNVTRLTLEQQKEILNIYGKTIENLSSKIGRAKSGTLTERWLKDYRKAVTAERNAMRKELSRAITKGINKAAQQGADGQKGILGKIQQAAGIDFGPHFTDMFSRVAKDVVGSIISGELYKDGRSLSERIWTLGSDFGKDVQYIVSQGLIEKKSAIELARDLEKYVKEPSRRQATWGKAYPDLKNKQVDYNAMRLARTTINHSYQGATVKSSAMNPYVDGIEWHSAMIHGRTCQLCMDRDGQIFPKDDVPLDHPNGLCTMIPAVSKSLDAIADELHDWIYGGENQMLDDWYDKYFDGAKQDKHDIIKATEDPKLRVLLNAVEKLKSIDSSDRKQIAETLLNKLGLQNILVSVEPIKNAHGKCLMDANAIAKGENKITDYVLNSRDQRSDSYKIKTAFHEAYHAKGNGMKTDMATNPENWRRVEETFAETSAHYLYHQTGLSEEIAPSYANYLVDMLPRLKQLDRFKDCTTFDDFGKAAWADRLNGVSPEWQEMHKEAMAKKHDWKGYLSKYSDYIDKNESDLLDTMLNNMPEYKPYKSDMANDYLNARAKIGRGESLTSNEAMVARNLLSVAMGRLGVK